jgi:hypothetical protein
MLSYLTNTCYQLTNQMATRANCVPYPTKSAPGFEVLKNLIYLAAGRSFHVSSMDSFTSGDSWMEYLCIYTRPADQQKVGINGFNYGLRPGFIAYLGRTQPLAVRDLID